MNWRLFISLLGFSIGALILAVVGEITGETILRAYALAVLSLGLAFHSLMITLRTDKKINDIESSIIRIAEIQEQIKKAQEQPPSSQKPLLATLEGLSQYYLDYITRQKKDKEA